MFPATALARGELVEERSELAFDLKTTVGGVSYECLGTGLRKVFLFQVYAVAFCLDASKVKETIAAAKSAGSEKKFFGTLVRSKANKLVIMRMVRDVSKKKMAGAFRDSLGRILASEKIDKLIDTIPGDAEEDQSVLLYSNGSKLMIEISGNRKEIDDSEISSKLWQVWLGPGSVTPGLKENIAERAGL